MSITHGRSACKNLRIPAGPLAVEIAEGRDSRVSAVLDKIRKTKVHGEAVFMGENGKSLGFNILSVANQGMPTSTALISRELLKITDDCRPHRAASRVPNFPPVYEVRYLMKITSFCASL